MGVEAGGFRAAMRNDKPTAAAGAVDVGLVKEQRMAKVKGRDRDAYQRSRVFCGSGGASVVSSGLQYLRRTERTMPWILQSFTMMGWKSGLAGWRRILSPSR